MQFSTLEVNGWLSKFEILLDIEKQAELDQIFSSEHDTDYVAQTKGSIIDVSIGLFGKQIIEIDNDEGFRVGDVVGILLKNSKLSEAKQWDVSGVVSKARNSGIVSIVCDEGSDELFINQRVTLVKVANDITFKRIRNVFSRMSKLPEHCKKVFDVVFGQAALANISSVSFEPFNKGLNPSQMKAIGNSLGSNDISIVHGPPGTGKTTTVVEFIRQSVKMGQRVLACAPSNVAVDNLVEALLKPYPGFKCSLLRVGHPARLSEGALEVCLEARINGACNDKVLHGIRKEIGDLNNQLSKAYGSKKKPLRIAIRQLQREIRDRQKKCLVDVFATADVVLATNIGAGSSVFRDSKCRAFDVVVLDEVGQSIEPESYVPLMHAKRVVLAGDPQQLPPTIISKEAARDGLQYTLLDRSIDQLKEFAAGSGDEECPWYNFLDTQYRMNHNISDWSSKEMYSSKLFSDESVSEHLLMDLLEERHSYDDCELKDGENDELLSMPLVHVDTAGCDMDDELFEESRRNVKEAVTVATICRMMIEEGSLEPVDIAIVTPYNGQVSLLRHLLHSKYPKIEIRSVDGFQGREKELIVLSMVRSNELREIGFLSDRRRTNVAVTRARRGLFVVGDSFTLQTDSLLKSLMEHIEENGSVRSALEFVDEEYYEMAEDYATRTRLGEDMRGNARNSTASITPAGKNSSSSITTAANNTKAIKAKNKSKRKSRKVKNPKSECKPIIPPVSKTKTPETTAITSTSDSTGHLNARRLQSEKQTNAETIKKNTINESSPTTPEIKSKPHANTKANETAVLVLKCHTLISNFLKDDSKKILRIPSLNSFERRLIHALCEKTSLSHSSEGNGNKRVIIIQKK